MTEKILFCATVDYHFKAFHLPIMKWFKEQGWEVHVAANGDLELPHVDRKFSIPIQRSPFRWSNLQAYRELKEIVDEGDYSLIHCHTPLGGVLTRLAARQTRSSGAKVLYTAHGFHFCKGAPLPNWMLYYPVEKWLATYTDCLITINSEDYSLAQNKRFKAKEVKLVHGVGVDMSRFKPISTSERARLRERFGYRQDHFLMFYAAEFNRNKNHTLLLDALVRLKDKTPNARLLLAGRGPLLDECRRQAVVLGVSSMIDFLGYRDDVATLLPMCDAAVSSSLREGLPVNIMEAMACGLPVIAVRNRGHEELIQEGKNGFLVDPQDPDVFAARLQLLIYFEDMRQKLGRASMERMQHFSLDHVKMELAEIYTSQIRGGKYVSQNQHHRAYIQHGKISASLHGELTGTDPTRN